MRTRLAAAVALAGCAAAAGALGTAPKAAPSAGERAFQKCYSCHALEPGRNDLSGPTLHGIVGRGIAAEPGFKYSPALRHLGAEHKLWTRELLDRFIADPEATVPGTSMTFNGIKNEAERRELIGFLGRAAQ